MHSFVKKKKNPSSINYEKKTKERNRKKKVLAIKSVIIQLGFLLATALPTTARRVTHTTQSSLITHHSSLITIITL
jgi:hypothetical protein